MMLLHDQPHYHRETEGTEILSRTYESNEVLTPLQIPSRPTVSQDRTFVRFFFLSDTQSSGNPFTAASFPVELKGSMEELHCLHCQKTTGQRTSLHVHLSKDTNIMVVVYSLGQGRSLPTDQYYVTQLKKSDVRMNDELLRKPPDSSAKSPEDRDTGVYASSHQPFHPNIPTKPFDVVVLGKTRGNAYRHEVVSIPSDSQKKAVCWPGQHGYFQV
ncbi:hypothetical protein Q9233_015951 [Columba guinea]|nr:hypothetical protein Q9233_015951 [Columba guinea]